MRQIRKHSGEAPGKALELDTAEGFACMRSAAGGLSGRSGAGVV